MRVDRMNGTPLGVVFNFGGHPVVRYPYTSRISADWPGLVAAYLKYKIPGVSALFLQAPCGNINANNMTWGRTDISMLQKVGDMFTGDVAKRFSDQMLPALERIETKPITHIESVCEKIDLPCASLNAEELQNIINQNVSIADSMTLDELRPLYKRFLNETPEEIAWRNARYEVDACRHQLELLKNPPYQVEAIIQVMMIGEAIIVGWPGEIFLELGLALRQASPFPATFVASFANHNVGYIPTPEAYESQGKPNLFGGYPCSFTPKIYRNLPFRSDVGTNECAKNNKRS